MPKWAIDEALKQLEPESISWDHGPARDGGEGALRAFQLHVTSELEGGTVWLWVLGIGKLHRPKRFFYGKTIRQAVQRALRAKQAGKIDFSWG